jgi:hypothetical protein
VFNDIDPVVNPPDFAPMNQVVTVVFDTVAVVWQIVLEFGECGMH